MATSTTKPTPPAEEPKAAATQTPAPTTDGNPAVTPELGVGSSKVEPGTRTGYHCGHCGQQVGREGQHYNEQTGEQRETPHAGTLVLADNWAEDRVQ